MSSDGFSAARTRRIVATRSASPSSAKYSQCSGISTASAATSALSVSRPSDGGQSMKMWSKRSRSGVEEAPQLRFAAGQRDHLDFGAGEIAIGGQDEQIRNVVARMKSSGISGAAVGRRQRVIDGSAAARLSPQADAAGQVALGIDIDEQNLASVGGEGRGKVDGGRGLADAALLVGDAWILFILQDLHIIGRVTNI